MPDATYYSEQAMNFKHGTTTNVVSSTECNRQSSSWFVLIVLVGSTWAVLLGRDFETNAVGFNLNFDLSTNISILVASSVNDTEEDAIGCNAAKPLISADADVCLGA